MELSLNFKNTGLVDMTCRDNGACIEKTIDLVQLIDLLTSLKHEETKKTNYLDAVCLPKNTIAFKESDCGNYIELTLLVEEEVFPFDYEGTLFNVPYPAMLFKLKITRDKEKYRVNTVDVVAIITLNGMETELYKYPFSHVSGTSMCTGNIERREETSLSAYENLPRVIITIPNGTHHWSSDNNLSPYGGLRDVLMALEDLDDFPKEWLSPLNIKLKNWL